jgi:hypothetical protein
MAREAIELVILRTQCEMAERYELHLLNRIRDLHHATELIDGCVSVVSIKEHV